MKRNTSYTDGVIEYLLENQTQLLPNSDKRVSKHALAKMHKDYLKEHQVGMYEYEGKLIDALSVANLMEVEEILASLREMDISIDKETLRSGIEESLSVERFGDHLSDGSPYNLTGADEDFLLAALFTLEERWFPDLITFEALDDSMQRGYSCFDDGDDHLMADEWAKTWGILKALITKGGYHDIQEVNDDFGGMQDIGNWFDDFQEALWNLGIENPSYLEKRITILSEYLALEIDDSEYTQRYRPAQIAETYLQLGDLEKGDELFEACIKRFPNWGWHYIFWADAYSFGDNNPHKDNEKALAILKRGLEVKLEDDCKQQDLIDRMNYIDGANALAAGQPLAASKVPEIVGATKSNKVGRNSPCPCGSGKKYKKCCGGV